MHEVASQLRSFWVLSTSTPSDNILLSSIPEIDTTNKVAASYSNRFFDFGLY